MLKATHNPKQFSIVSYKEARTILSHFVNIHFILEWQVVGRDLKVKVLSLNFCTSGFNNINMIQIKRFIDVKQGDRINSRLSLICLSLGRQVSFLPVYCTELAQQENRQMLELLKGRGRTAKLPPMADFLETG